MRDIGRAHVNVDGRSNRHDYLFRIKFPHARDVMNFIMRRRMSDQLTFLKRLDVGQASRQPDVKKINRQCRQAEQRQHERHRNNNDAPFELCDADHAQLRPIMIQ